MRHVCKLIVASLLLSPLLALAAVPATVAFSARVKDNGQPVTGTQHFVFVLWDDPTAGNNVWQEPAAGTKDLAVTDGVVTTALGDTVALPAFTGTPWFLEVTMNGTTFPQRIPIQSVPYALAAGNVPRVAARTNQNTGVKLSTTCANSGHYVDLTFPGPGTVTVDATIWLQLVHTTGTLQQPVLGIETSPSAGCADWANAWVEDVPATVETRTVYKMARVMKTIPVSAAGTLRFYVNGYMATGSSGSDYMWWGATRAVWYSN